MSSNPDNTTQRWEGYSDYQSVSNRVVATLDDAIDAYAYIESLHAENERIRQREAAEARSRILAAAMKLVPELEANTAGTGDDADEENVEAEILGRWTDSYDGGDGLLDRLQGVQLQTECPDWLRQLARDIRKAGFEIGYLQAGRTVSESTLEPTEEQAREMFQE